MQLSPANCDLGISTIFCTTDSPTYLTPSKHGWTRRSANTTKILAHRMLLGLKLEEGVPSVLGEKINDWVPAPTTAIPEMEALLRRMEQFDYPSETTRENIILEKEFDIGTGRVRSFQDKDGDLTVMFQHQLRHSAHIDEDAAFGLGVSSMAMHGLNGPNAAGKANTPGRQALNAKSQDLGAAEAPAKKTLAMPTLEEVRESQAQGTNKTAVSGGLEPSECEEMPLGRIGTGRSEEEVHRETRTLPTDFPFSPTSSKKRTAKKTAVPASTEKAISLFKKRPISSSINISDPVKSAMKTLLLKMGPYGGKSSRDADIKKKPRPKISFMSRNVQLAGSTEDSVFLISMIRFNKVNRTRGVFEENFYLEPLNEAASSPNESKRSVRLMI